MSPQTEQYLDLARQGRNEWWRYALGVLIIAFFWLALGYVPYLLLLGSGLDADPMLDFVAVNFSIFMMLAGLALAVRLIHRRPLASLLAPDARVDWGRIGRGAAAWGVIAAVIVVIEHLLFPDRYYLSFNPERFFAFLVLVLALTPIQSATEELIFRGYAMQGFGLLTRRPALIAVLSSLVFTAPHLLNPEVERHGALIMAANYFAIGMLLATVTLRDGRLELAIGLHAVNNTFLALVANYESSALMTESVFTARELDPVYALVALITGALVFHWWIFRRASENPERMSGRVAK
ncbi:MAG: CPBP family intramembrane metalloprotease [Betaproteobacteria bacterium]|nr:CPBP family intramembrane metalloprotease [Betaproteobacteria bacterium]